MPISDHAMLVGHLGSHVLDLVEGSFQHRVNICQHVLLCSSHFLVSHLLDLCVNVRICTMEKEAWYNEDHSKKQVKFSHACALLRAAATAPTTFPAEEASQTTMAPSRPASLYI